MENIKEEIEQMERLIALQEEYLELMEKCEEAHRAAFGPQPQIVPMPYPVYPQPVWPYYHQPQITGYIPSYYDGAGGTYPRAVSGTALLSEVN